MIARKIFCAAAIALVAAGAAAAAAPKAPNWETEGSIYGTDITFSDLAVDKNGVNVRLTNTFETPVRVSIKLTFIDKTGNAIGQSIFGLREIPAGKTVDIWGNHLDGKWRACREAAKAIWQKMTYKIVLD